MLLHRSSPPWRGFQLSTSLDPDDPLAPASGEVADFAGGKTRCTGVDGVISQALRRAEPPILVGSDAIAAELWTS